MVNNNVRKILWYSEDNMTTEQMDELARIYGHPVIITHFSGPLKNADELINLGKTYGADAFAAGVLPMTILADLTNPKLNTKPVLRELYRRVSTGNRVVNPATGIKEDECTFEPDGWEQVIKVAEETKRL